MGIACGEVLQDRFLPRASQHAYARLWSGLRFSDSLAGLTRGLCHTSTVRGVGESSVAVRTPF